MHREISPTYRYFYRNTTNEDVGGFLFLFCLFFMLFIFLFKPCGDRLYDSGYKFHNQNRTAIRNFRFIQQQLAVPINICKWDVFWSVKIIIIIIITLSRSPDPLVNAQLYDIPREDILSWIYLIPHVTNLNGQLTRITFPQLRE